MQAICPLCQTEAALFHKDSRSYFRCPNCEGIFVAKNDLPLKAEEKNRYSLHENDMEDPGYIEFTSPIVEHIKSNLSPDQLGLDYGSGTGPVITHHLRKDAYQIRTYDPFFDPDSDALNQSYDYIFCCEVIEHFHEPAQEFRFLKNALKPTSQLICMTDIYDSSIDFENWYYKNDQTHVFFYSKKTLRWIKQNFDFSNLTIDNRLIVFYN